MIVELFGPPGAGKTTFARTLAAHLRERGHTVDLILSHRPATFAPQEIRSGSVASTQQNGIDHKPPDPSVRRDDGIGAPPARHPPGCRNGVYPDQDTPAIQHLLVAPDRAIRVTPVENLAPGTK